MRIAFVSDNTYPWFKERVYKLEDDHHDTKNFEAAMKRAQEWGNRIPIGVFYQAERMTYEEGEPAMAHGAMSKLPNKPLDPSILLEFV